MTCSKLDKNQKPECRPWHSYSDALSQDTMLPSLCKRTELNEGGLEINSISPSTSAPGQVYRPLEEMKDFAHNDVVQSRARMETQI